MEDKEKNAINFLLFSYFGITLDATDEEIIDSVIDRAYRDACSHVLSVVDSKKETKKSNAKEIIEKFLKNLPNTNDEYDKKHKDCVKELWEAYGDCDCDYKNIKKKNKNETYQLKFTYGIAQKWLNMTMKYLYILNNFNFKDKKTCRKVAEISSKLHVPIDSYIIDAANNRFKITKPNCSWSQMNYEQYDDYQKKIKDAVKGNLIDWEGPEWIEIAKGKKADTQSKKEKYIEEREGYAKGKNEN